MEKKEVWFGTYKESCERLNLYSSLRLKQLAIFLFVMGGFITFLVSQRNEICLLSDGKLEHIIWLISLAIGFLLHSLFFFLERRAHLQYEHFLSTAKDLEKNLEIELYLKRPENRSARLSVLLTYAFLTTGLIWTGFIILMIVSS